MPGNELSACGAFIHTHTHTHTEKDRERERERGGGGGGRGGEREAYYSSHFPVGVVGVRKDLTPCQRTLGEPCCKLNSLFKAAS